MRGIGYETSEESVRQVFSRYGELEECSLIMDKMTGRTKGYGFVSANDLVLALLRSITCNYEKKNNASHPPCILGHVQKYRRG